MTFSHILFQSFYCLYYYLPNYNVLCQPPNFSNTFNGRKEAIGTYYYYLLKLLDLADTVFFVLRKKSSQVSFLHVYHHVAILIASYLIFSWTPGIHNYTSFRKNVVIN